MGASIPLASIQLAELVAKPWSDLNVTSVMNAAFSSDCPSFQEQFVGEETVNVNWHNPVHFSLEPVALS